MAISYSPLDYKHLPILLLIARLLAVFWDTLILPNNLFDMCSVIKLDPSAYNLGEGREETGCLSFCLSIDVVIKKIERKIQGGSIR